jgi:hypothetical protein
MINEFLTTKERRYTLRPFNRFDTERSLWWIVPSTHYPAFKFGKFFVDEDENGDFQVGLHIEKGLAHSIEKNPEIMMDDTWTWHRFIEDVASGQVEEQLREVQKGIGNDAGITVRFENPDLMDAGDGRGATGSKSLEHT